MATSSGIESSSSSGRLSLLELQLGLHSVYTEREHLGTSFFSEAGVASGRKALALAEAAAMTFLGGGGWGEEP